MSPFLRSMSVAALGGALLVAASAQSATFTLADLVAGGTFTSDDGKLTFSDFEVTKIKKLSGNLSLYTITTTLDGFTLSSPELTATAGGLRKLNFGYTVTASTPILQAGLDVTGTAATGRFKVEKDIDDPLSDEGTFLVALKTQNREELSDSDQFSTGALSFAVEEQVRIKKQSEISSITNSFQLVPEPGTLLLLGTGIAGLFAIGRKRTS